MNILDMLDMYGEDSCRKILSSFICPLNPDVADFIHNKAIDFARQKIAITFLIFKNTSKGVILVGYYTLANHFTTISADNISKTLQKRIAKFSQYDRKTNQYLLSLPLIAQLGKNFSDNAKEFPISGVDLLTLACQNIISVQRIIGGKMTYIECASNSKLFDFYSRNQFYPFGERFGKGSSIHQEITLVQMLRYFTK